MTESPAVQPEVEFHASSKGFFAFLIEDEGFVGPERQVDGCCYYAPALSVGITWISVSSP